jgi:hypothetical protein
MPAGNVSFTSVGIKNVSFGLWPLMCHPRATSAAALRFAVVHLQRQRHLVAGRGDATSAQDGEERDDQPGLHAMHGGKCKHSHSGGATRAVVEHHFRPRRIDANRQC